MEEDDGFMSDFDFPSDTEIGAFAPSKPACPHPRNSNRTSHYTKWTSEEDDLLKEAADQLKFDWTMIAKHFPGKTSACVRKRWDLKHNPSTIKSKWTVEEDELILKLMRELGGGFWKSISKQMPGRPPDVIKNRYYSVLRRRINKSDPLQPSQNGQPAQNYREPELTPETQLADDCVFDFLSLGTDTVSLQPALALCSREEKLKKVAMLESTLEVLHDLLRRTKSEISDLAQELNENEGIMEALPS